MFLSFYLFLSKLVMILSRRYEEGDEDEEEEDVFEKTKRSPEVEEEDDAMGLGQSTSSHKSNSTPRQTSKGGRPKLRTYQMNLPLSAPSTPSNRHQQQKHPQQQQTQMQQRPFSHDFPDSGNALLNQEEARSAAAAGSNLFSPQTSSLQSTSPSASASTSPKNELISLLRVIPKKDSSASAPQQPPFSSDAFVDSSTRPPYHIMVTSPTISASGFGFSSNPSSSSNSNMSSPSNSNNNNSNSGGGGGGGGVGGNNNNNNSFSSQFVFSLNKGSQNSNSFSVHQRKGSMVCFVLFYFITSRETTHFLA